MGDRAPSVQVVFRVHCEMDADVLAAVRSGSSTGPRAWDHQAGTGRKAAVKRLVDALVGCVTEAEVVAIDDEQSRVGRVTQALREFGHSEKVAPAGLSSFGRRPGQASKTLSQAASAGGRAASARARLASSRPFRAARLVRSSMYQARVGRLVTLFRADVAGFSSPNGRCTCCSIRQ